jgi:hypothetical protein
MSIFSKIKTLFAKAEDVADDLAPVVSLLGVFVQMAEDTGKTGSEKLAFVKELVRQVLPKVAPKLVPKFDDLWPELVKQIENIVAVAHFIGIFYRAVR